MKTLPSFRIEHDLLGERQVSAEAYYGIHTLRALENFPISGTAIDTYPNLARALACVKQACAQANHEFEQKQNELRFQQEQEMARANAQLERQRFQKILVLIFSLLLIIILFLIFRNLKREKKSALKIQEQNRLRSG